MIFLDMYPMNILRSEELRLRVNEIKDDQFLISARKEAAQFFPAPQFPNFVHPLG